MLKRFVSGLLALFLIAGLVDAQELRPVNFGNNVGSAKTDTMIWFASGSIPGTANRVDTMVAGTLNDTTYGIEIAGASQVSVEIIGRSKNDDQDLTYYGQVSNQNIITGAWHSLATTYSVDVTAGSAVGQSENTGRDSTMWVLLNTSGGVDTLLAPTTAAGMEVSPNADQMMVRNSRFFRLWFDPDSSAGDSVYISAVITRIYPR